MDDLDDDCLFEICNHLTLSSKLALLSTSKRLNHVSKQSLNVQSKLLVYKRAPISDWPGLSDNGPGYKRDPTLPDSIVLDICKNVTEFEGLLNKLPKLKSITFGVYTSFTNEVINVLNERLADKVISMSFYFPFFLSGRRLNLLRIDNLTILRIRYGGLAEPDLKLILTKCTKLEVLDMTGNWYISGFSFTHFEGRLKSLAISRCSGITIHGLQSITYSTSQTLEHLEIDFTGSGDKIEPELFLICSEMKKLKSLSIRSSSFSGRDSSYIRWLTNLTNLNICEMGPMLTDESLTTILSKCIKIENLTLDLCHSRTLVTNSVIENLNILSPNLKSLTIKNVLINNLSFDIISKLEHLQKLTLARCGRLPDKILNKFKNLSNLDTDNCDAKSLLEDAIKVSKLTPKKNVIVKAGSVESLAVASEPLPRNLKFKHCRRFSC